MGKRTEFLFEGVLILLISIGLVFRFNWVDWSQGTNLHPDEYGLTNTLIQLSIPSSISDYFNTRLSSLSPYQKYDVSGQATVNGPDNRMRWGQWPIILIRGLAEITGNISYNEIRLMGRRLSAFADTISLAFIFLIGLRLYNRKTGLLAATLSALAVMQIQQSHFMTVDNFGALFTVIAIYACVRIAQRPCATRTFQGGSKNHSLWLAYQIDHQYWKWCVLFATSYGMAIASKINLLPLGGMVLIALFLGSIANLKLKIREDLYRIPGIAGLYLIFIILVTLITFRVTQPMSFREPVGDTTFFSFHPNPDWVESIKVARSESNGIGGGPPGEQWAHRPAIIFPLINMVLWGMGLPLGLASWISFLWVTWRFVRWRENWKAHLLPLVWTGGYFLFMGTRWVKSIRYFLPIYPFLCLFAAWGLMELWRRNTRVSESKDLPATLLRFPIITKIAHPAISLVMIAMVVFGTLIWAYAFTDAIYQKDHTRIQAARWIFRNIAAPFHLTLEGSGEFYTIPISASDREQIIKTLPFVQPFVSPTDGNLSVITIPHAAVLDNQGQGQLHIVVANDPEGKMPVGDIVLTIDSFENNQFVPEVRGKFNDVALEKAKSYYLIVSSLDDQVITISRTVISNESWDEGLPMPLDGWDSFGQFYRGLTMEVRWYDDENKRQMFLDTLTQVDYIVLPSQRSIWSTCRIPLTYPMTMESYRALFDGRLGFDLVASFTSPIHLGPLSISDVGGTIAWNRTPDLPLFNHNLVASEEAFSVYDHPPVWIFKKRPDFSIEAVEKILDSVDLDEVIIQSPRDATGSPCQ